ncbi:tetratricopeptide repeat protein [Methanosarcina sp. 1.H.A.2.2]|uniref:tetratricopeptide repeat protein n=1 Tax=Methanosarcina sp. 1.H.A.2.2 TaxID=1483601 RepID=UPI00062264BA|nr:tetratricopeptide repeat protein [Methanosarcina sp. 1.H.A.2.2]KKH45727.1 hypothetical protein EO93_02350 [Methanosarcina sp. 1.H.A.2.2]
MSVCPTPLFGKNEGPFVDRKEYIKTFETAVKNIGSKNYSVLVYYGVGGIGKTSLRKELLKKLKDQNQSCRNKFVWTTVDFSIESHRKVDSFLGILKSELQEKYDIKFHLFDIAYASYWQKVNPQIPFSKDGYSEDSIVTDLLDLVGGYYFSINYSNVKKIVEKAPNHLNEWWLKRNTDIKTILDKEPSDLRNLLPAIFARDLDDYLEKNSKSAIFFLDSYETLWEKEEKGKYNSRDEWIREIVANLTESALWVICGREKLRWEEEEKDWSNYLDQYKLEKLPDEDALNFLNLCKVEDEEIQRVIVKGSEGVPYYLELAVDTYTEIIKTSYPKPEDFARTHSKIFVRFMKHLDTQEQETLKIISTLRFWNVDILRALVNTFMTGYSLTKLSELNRFSFIQESEGKFQLHPLMKESLQAYQSQESKEDVNSFMCDYYTKKIENMNIKSMTIEHETLLTEAFFHAKNALATKDLYKWFTTFSNPFYDAASYQLIIPMYEEMLQIIESESGLEYPFVTTILNNLASLYLQIGKYDKALPKFQRALEIEEKVLGSEHSIVATTQNNIAALYDDIGKYGEALEFYQKSLAISEKVLGSEHPDVGLKLNNLAGIYQMMDEHGKALELYYRAFEIFVNGPEPDYKNISVSLSNISELCREIGEYEEALELNKKAHEIMEQLIGSEHPDIATSLNNRALIYQKMGEYEKAIQLYEEVLEIIKKTRGSEHPYIVAAENNLALLLEDIEEYEKAIEHYIEAINLIDVIGLEHPYTALTVKNFGSFCLCTGQFENAIFYCKWALEYYENQLGPEHPDIANILNNLAIAYLQLEVYEESLPLFERSLKILETKVGTDHPDYKAVEVNIQDIKTEMKEKSNH